MILRLKFLLCLNGKLFDFKNVLFKHHGFSVKYMLVRLSKDVCIRRIGTGKNYSIYTIIQC